MATTNTGLKLAELGSFEDDPSADDVWLFAQKMNENLIALDITVAQAENAANNLEQIEAKGVISGVLYGGRGGIA